MAYRQPQPSVVATMRPVQPGQSATEAPPLPIRPTSTPPTVVVTETPAGPTETIPAETPTETPVVIPTDTPIPPPTFTATVVAETPTAQPPSTSTLAPTAETTVPPLPATATDVPPGPGTDEDQGNPPSDTALPDQGLPETSVELTDPMTGVESGLLGETRPDQKNIAGFYEDGHYRLEINGPEVAPDLIALVRAPNLVDTTIAATVQLQGITDGRYVTAICREVDGYGGYRVYLSPSQGYFAITRFVPGEVPVLLQDGFSGQLIQETQPFSFEFSCVGYLLQLKVDDEIIGIATDNAFASGSVSIGTGFFTNAPAGPVIALFSDLTVTGQASLMVSAAGPDGHGRPDFIGPSTGDEPRRRGP